MDLRWLCWCTIAVIILTSLWYQRHNIAKTESPTFHQVINSGDITTVLSVVNASYWQRHAQALREPEHARFLLFKRGPDAGWGNSLSAVATAFTVALLTERTLILDWSNKYGEQSWGNFFTSPALMDLLEIKRAYNLSMIAGKLYRPGHRLARISESVRNLNLVTLGSVDLLAIEEQHVIITEYHSSTDWLLPLLYINPHHNATITRWFTYGRIFQQLAAILLQPAPSVTALGRPFQFPATATHCIGVQIRRRRDNIPLTKYLNVAKIIARERGYHSGNTVIHIAADQPKVRAEAVALFIRGLGFKISVLPAENVFNPVGKEGLNRDSVVGLQYGLVEMQLLSQCEEILVAHGSSFGYIAAAWHGTKATFITLTGHFKALVSDPCMWSANLLKNTYGDGSGQYPHELFEHYLQCHPPVHANDI